MKTLAVLCNIALLAFTLFLLATEGTSEQLSYNVFALLLLLIPLLTIFAIARSAGGSGALQRIAAVGNLALLGLVVWATIDQYPHPDEPGVLEFILLAVLVPLLSVVVLLRRRAGAAR